MRDELVLDAMRKVPRELFLRKSLCEFAYEDLPLPITGEQTISQPYIVAFMAEALILKGSEKVLEIGAGSGYAGCLTPWQRDPTTYGHAALTGSYPTCESHVVRALTDLLAKRQSNAEHDGERFLDAEQNARLVANAERYYRIMYSGSRA